VTVGALVVGVTAFVFDVVVSDPASLTVGIILGAVIAVLWIAVTVLMRGRSMEGSER
jgi:hypothetical protein